MTVAEFLSPLTHNGSEILWPSLPEPKCRRGFVMSEMLYCAQQQGKYFTPVFPSWPSCPSLGATPFTVVTDPAWLRKILTDHEGVLCYPGHAVAWNRERIYDPDGPEYLLKEGYDAFWMEAPC